MAPSSSYALADSVLLTPRFLQSMFGLKPAIRSTLRTRFAKSVLDRRPALIVLLYHAVDPSPPQYLRDLGVVTHPHAFEDHLLWAKSCFELVSLSEGIRRLRSGTLTKTCLALTFDDGLKSVADHAVPVLIRHGIPAALFVNHASLTGRRCWIYDVAQLESEGRKEALEEVFGTSCPGLFSSYLRHQAPADVLARRSGLADLSSRLNGNRVEYINHEELAKLLESPLMELGNHSLDHPRFSHSGLRFARRRHTINGGRAGHAWSWFRRIQYRNEGQSSVRRITCRAPNRRAVGRGRKH